MLQTLLEVVQRMRRHGVEPSCGHTFQAGRKGEAHDRIVAGVDHHLVSKMPDAPNWAAYFGVVVKSWSRELPRELALQNLLGERRVRDFDS